MMNLIYQDKFACTSWAEQNLSYFLQLQKNKAVRHVRNWYFQSSSIVPDGTEKRKGGAKKNTSLLYQQQTINLSQILSLPLRKALPVWWQQLKYTASLSSLVGTLRTSLNTLSDISSALGRRNWEIL